VGQQSNAINISFCFDRLFLLFYYENTLQCACESEREPLLICGGNQPSSSPKYHSLDTIPTNKNNNNSSY
jgi:hypothetical protein